MLHALALGGEAAASVKPVHGAVEAPVGAAQSGGVKSGS